VYIELLFVEENPRFDGSVDPGEGLEGFLADWVLEGSQVEDILIEVGLLPHY
jgi:hypothetical protein